MSKSRVVFIGNIPYDKTETQLIEIFSSVGTVLSMRFVPDRETGKPKGYGFCTYQDYETAASAVRNLNNYDIGGRQLRVNFADSDKEAMMEGDTKESSIQQIQSSVNQMDPRSIAEALSYLKSLAHSNPELANQLLLQEPQLSLAILQALIKMKLVSQESMQRLLSSQGQYKMQPAPVVPPMVPPVQMMADQQQLLMRVINLTPQEIQNLPPEQQAQVLQLKAQFLAQGIPQ